jgi:hypothetical protein
VVAAVSGSIETSCPAQKPPPPSQVIGSVARQLSDSRIA